MRFDPRALERVASIDARKANRTTSVRRLPARAEAGDTVVMDGEFHVYVDNKWHAVSAGMQEAVTALAARVKALEDSDG